MMDKQSMEKYNYAFLDEGSKREIRRSVLKAVAIPGYQVPFGSRELPIGRGWGTGGIQLTLSLIGPEDTLKVIDQGSDESVNAVNIKKFVRMCTGVPVTTRTQDATLIQTRHRVRRSPCATTRSSSCRCPCPSPCASSSRRRASPRRCTPSRTTRPSGSSSTRAWSSTARSPSPRNTLPGRGPLHHEPQPHPKFDNPKLHEADCLYLFGAGREKKIYAIPPHTKVVSLAFDDVPFERESFAGKKCRLCGSTDTYLDEILRLRNGREVLPVLRYILLPGGAFQVQMRLQETPVLSVQHLTVRYGEGCPHCLAGGKLEKNRCPKCGTVYAANDISLDVYPGRC